MATCENTTCNKSNLRKSDVELDADLGLLLCTGCYCARHPGWVPEGPIYSEVLTPMAFSYDFSISSDGGLNARVGYGDISVSVHAPLEDIKRVLGVD